MRNIISFPCCDVKEYRQKCCFMNRGVQVKDEDGKLQKYPCIVIYEKGTDIPILYTGLERYICHLNKSEYLSGKTLSARAYAVCHFLNYILRETNINSLHECKMETVRDFLKSMKMRESGNEYKKDTWLRYRDYVVDFLVMYYAFNNETLSFQYKDKQLRSVTIINSDKYRKKVAIVQNASLHIKQPQTTHKKNRILVDGYLELLLYTAKKYEPDITLGIALGAYAGLREGEIVNVTCGGIHVLRNGFEVVSGIEIDLTDEAPYFKNWNKKTDPGTIKKKRTQKVYNDFISDIRELYEYHIGLMESRKYCTDKDAPLFVNKQGKPMTVQTYSDRVKKLFYDKFLPSLEILCEKEGTYADNASFIEAYYNEYPGAHMFRHWFTMYLLTKAKLTSGEIMKWRGDSSQESMNDYICENADLIKVYRDSSYTFQSQILEDIINARDQRT